MICWVLSASLTASSVGRARVSSIELVWSDWVPPNTAASACSVVRTTLFIGCWAVIAADTDGVPLRNLLGAIADGIHDQAEVRLRREQPFFLGDVFLEDVVLQRPAEALERDAAPFRDRQVHGEEDRRRAVDRHGRGNLIERDPVEEAVHILQGGNRHAAIPDLAAGAGVARIQTH